MTDQNQREWPTFGDILTELNSLGQLSATLAGGALSSDSEWVRKTAAEISGSSANTGRSANGTLLEADRLVDSDSVAMPEQLAPASFDTTLLEDSPTEPLMTPTGESSFDTSALEPLEPLEPLDALDSPEALEVPEALDSPEADIEPAMGTEADIEPAMGALDDAHAPDETPALFDFEALEDIESPIDDAPASDLFAGAGLDPITGEINWAEAEWDEPANDPAAALAAPLPDWSDEHEDSDVGELHGGIVFPFAAAPSPDKDAEDPFGIPAGEAAMTDSSQATGFDSIATADAIENDLQDLFELDQVQEDNDNVVPLHPSSDDHSDQVVGLDTVFDQDSEHEPLQEWVGVDPADIGPKDPWAHMRPTEEEDDGGFWSNRPKFFGGDERKAKKKERQVTATDQIKSRNDADEQEGNEDFPCPSCHKGGHVELEDPKGHKVHLSCHSCGQVWAQSYSDEDQRSA